MENNLVIIREQEVFGKEFKIYGTFENPLFLAKDVAEWIEYSKREDGSYQVGQMLKSVDITDKISTVNNLNGKEMWFLTEDGLYEVLMLSRKPIAREFKKEVKQILKDIRKHGFSMTTEKVEEFLLNPDTMISVLTKYKEEKELRISLQVKLEEQKPLVQFAESVTNSADTIDIGQLAKLANDENIQIGRNRLFKWLRDKGMLRHNNEPYQKYIENGWFTLIEQTIKTPYGTKLCIKTLVFGKGQVGIIEMLKREFGTVDKVIG